METGAGPLLVVGPSWVGDMVMAQSLFIATARQNPGIEIDVLSPAWSLPMLSRMPQVRTAIEMPLGHGELGLRKRQRLGSSLRTRQYVRAIVLPRSFKAALVPFHAKIPVRTGYRGGFRYGLINDQRPAPDKSVPTVLKYLGLGDHDNTADISGAPSPSLRVDKENQAALISAMGLAQDRRIVAMMPGAEFGPAKCWPLNYFGELAKSITDRSDTVWILGSQKDHEAGAQIAAAAGAGARNLCGETQLVDTIDLLALANAAVTNDSGLMHVAAAAGTPVLALYGSSSPARTPPLSDAAKVLYLDLECSPCFKRRCPLQHLNCLKKITPAMAAGVLDVMLQV